MARFQHITGARCMQTAVPMRDGARLNTFVYLPDSGDDAFPVLLQRTPYGITAPGSADPADCTQGWLPDPAQPLRGSLLRGWRAITARGYAAVYQDTRGRFGSEGEDTVYGNDAEDGEDTLLWLARQPWSNQRVGLSGSSAGATTALAAAASGHPSVRAFFAQAGASSIYDDVVYEGQSIEMERLWLWVAKNIPGLSRSHRAAAAARAGISSAGFDDAAARALTCYERLEAACAAVPPFIDSAEWLRLPLAGTPEFSVCQPYLDEILSHPAPDAFRARHDFRRGIRVPGLHITSWYDIFQSGVIAAFTEARRRCGKQWLWIGPNHHYFVYEREFWPRDPYFEWFGHWLKDEPAAILDEPSVYYATQAWTGDASARPRWQHATGWPPPHSRRHQLHLTGDGRLTQSGPGGAARSFRYDPRRPVPTLGGRNMLIAPGPMDQRPIETRPDYGLIYRSAPLRSELRLAGPAAVTLHVDSDCRDTDFVARLVELRPDGAAIALMDGVIRAMLRQPARGVQHLRRGVVVSLRIELGHISHTIAAGCRLRVDIGSSNFPRRARNTNSGNLVLAADGDEAIRVARNSVHHDADTPSTLELTALDSVDLAG